MEHSSLSRTQASTLTEVLRADIISGHLAPGAKLRLKDLSSRYEVGVNPLREALSRLASSGFVEAEDQRGFKVTSLSREELLDITNTRQRLEADALRDSIEHGDIDWETRVMAALHKLSKVPMTPDLADNTLDPLWEQAHDDFHFALLSACRSTWSLRFALLLRDLSARYRYFSVRTPKKNGSRDVLKEHQAIAKATLDRDADLATQLLIDHLQETKQLVLRQIDESSLEDYK